MARFGMTGDWAGASSLLTALADKERWKKARKRAMLKEAHRLRRIMVESFNKGGPPGKRWQRLSVFTQLVSRALGTGDRRPLMNSGSLRNSHSVVEEGSDTVFVGVHRTAKRKSKGGGNSDMVQIAQLMENGSKPIYIRVTPKMRKFYLWLNVKTKGQIKPLKANTIAVIVRIPPRPWMMPIWDAEANNAANNILTDTLKNMNLPLLSSVL